MNTEHQMVNDFIKEHNIAVISTVTHDFLPESAVMGIYPGENFEIFFGTLKDSRKYQNLIKNPRVALVIGWDQGRTIQYEGEVVEISGDALKEFEKTSMATMPTAAKYTSDQNAAFFKIIPKWIKYTNASVDPWDEAEIKF